MLTFKEAEIKLVSMDFDDTLRQSYATISALMIELGTSFNLDITHHNIKKYWGQRPEELTREVFFELEMQGIDSWNVWKLFVNQYPDRLVMPLFEGVVKSLADLLHKGYYLGILSNGSTESIYQCIDTCLDSLSQGSDHPFLFIHTKDHCVKPKPHGEAFHSAFKLIEDMGLNIMPQNIVHIGDHHHDYNAAIASGVYPAMVTSGILSRNDFVESGINQKIIFSSFREIANELI